MNLPKTCPSIHPIPYRGGRIHWLKCQTGFTAASPASPYRRPEDAGTMRLATLSAHSEDIEIKGGYRPGLQGFIPQPEIGVQDTGRAQKAGFDERLRIGVAE